MQYYKLQSHIQLNRFLRHPSHTQHAIKSDYSNTFIGFQTSKAMNRSVVQSVTSHALMLWGPPAVVSSFCLHAAMGRMHFYWTLILNNVHIVLTNSGYMLRLWNSKWQTLCVVMVDKCETCFIQSRNHTTKCQTVTSSFTIGRDWFGRPLQTLKFYWRQFFDIWHSSLQTQLRKSLFAQIQALSWCP